MCLDFCSSYNWGFRGFCSGFLQQVFHSSRMFFDFSEIFGGFMDLLRNCIAFYRFLLLSIAFFSFLSILVPISLPLSFILPISNLFFFFSNFPMISKFFCISRAIPSNFARHPNYHHPSEFDRYKNPECRPGAVPKLKAIPIKSNVNCSFELFPFGRVTCTMPSMLHISHYRRCAQSTAAVSLSNTRKTANEIRLTTV